MSTVDEPRRRKTFRLHQSKIDTAQQILGTATETETIERALDLVLGELLRAGLRSARGADWSDPLADDTGAPTG